jgi:acyl carrier protein
VPDNDILRQLQAYVADMILEGHDVGLNGSTRLLELGVLNSMELMRLTAFIERRFGVAVPMSLIVAENFQTLDTIGALVERLAAGSSR